MAYCYMEKPRSPILSNKPIVRERSPISLEDSIFREELKKIRFEKESNKYATYYNTQFKLDEVQPSQEYVKDTIKMNKKGTQEMWMEQARDMKKAYEEAATLEQESKYRKTKVTQQTTVKMSSSEENSKVSLRKFKYPTLPRDEESHFGPRPSTSYADCDMNHGSNETRKEKTIKVDVEQTNANAGNNPRTGTLTAQLFLGKTKRRAPQPPRQNASTSKVHQETETGARTPEEPVNDPSPSDEEPEYDPPPPPPNDEKPVKDPPPTDVGSSARRTTISSGKSRLYINPNNEERLQGQAALCKALEVKYKADDERRNAKKTKIRSRWRKILFCCGECCLQCTECV